MPFDTYEAPRLLADIDGVHARFALELAPGEFAHTATLRCDQHADFHAVVSAYLAGLSGSIGLCRPRHAAVAIANPVAGDEVRMTHCPWQFSIAQAREALGLDSLVVVNDFTALAMALPGLLPNQRRQVGGGTAVPRSVVGLIGAGNGLGVSGLIPAGNDWVALGTEGGHASFAPCDEREVAILQFARRELGHVSFERLLSAPGLVLMHRALAEQAGQAAAPPDATEIVRRALAAEDALCAQALDTFCAILGTAAANLALTQGALGGIYIGGAIVPRLGAYFEQSPFRRRFEDKGRLSGYMQAIPTFVITATDGVLVGASLILAAQLREREATGNLAILEQIRRARPGLSPAEQRVADHMLAQPRTVLNDPIAQIARAADVSQPTVIRFCRSLGCEGLSDFKLRLASGLTGTIPITHTQVTRADSMVELGAKVLGNTASAILQVRDRLNRDSIDRAVRLITQAQRVEFYAVGHYGAVADDAQFKFLRVGLAAVAYTDPRLQLLAANLLNPQAVAVLISSSGRITELLQVADKARERGAAVVAITASQSPLARKADLALIVDHVEDVATHVPMISRILHLLMVDILVVGVTMRRGEQHLPQLNRADTVALDEEVAEPVLAVARRVSASQGGGAEPVSAPAPLDLPLTSHS